MVKRWFLDTEFMEEPGWMQLLSIAIVSEDGTEKLYAINREADIGRANDWVRKNVLPRLFKEWGQYAATLEQIRHEILQLIPPKPEDPGSEWHKPRFYGFYSDYDWVNFCWIFGKMIDLPNGYPMYCSDLHQSSDMLDAPKFPEPEGEHHALIDAQWNRQLYFHLKPFADDRGITI